MDLSGRAHHARALGTPSAGDSNPAGRRHETYPAVIRDRRWRRELDEHHSAAVRELGRVVITCAGTRPLLARPLIWQSDIGEASPAWHALAVTDRFVVAVDLTITDALTMKTFASIVRFIEIADVEATSQEVVASIRLRFGSADRTVPWPGTGRSQQAQDEMALLDAVTSHLAP